MAGDMIAPNDPDNYKGEIYLIIKGTNELYTPTQNPCKNLPEKRLNADYILIKTYEIMANISTMIILYLKLITNNGTSYYIY